ncbi:premnaspirodiene oxygenase [Ricinus communis]|uniref:CYP726A13 n=1 Tax=Ricinus communis TaxID=3988 RepID=B9RHW2_RICCO|nr:premnaspirodiene oxygenase [Ricinus communis]AIM47544.1 CYP726A13 [Ricinus communis]EEF48734.1 cytochrome P450, putative [Ricinus communis]|eukprot:NP_001310622.1 premnaspirodiene oxygenase [Ricinus communis]
MDKQILSYPVLLLSFLLFILMVLRIWKKSKGSFNSPPGPWKLPLIGNMHQLITPLPHHRLRELAKTHGPVMSIQLGQVSAVVISSVEAAKQVLKTQGELFAERPSILASKIVLYNGMDIIFGSYGDHWRQMRKICTFELLSPKRVQSFSSVRQEELSNYVRFLHSNAGSPVNLSKTLFALTNSVIAKIAVGKECKNQEALLNLIEEVLVAAGGFTVADSFPSYNFLHVITGMKSNLERLHRITDKILEDIITEHKAPRALFKRGGDEDKKEAENLLDVLLGLQEHGNLKVPLTNESVKSAILEMLSGGSDTSAKTIEWAMSELMRSPEAMEKAQEEVRRVFGELGKIEESRLHELKYLKLVIKETLRLHPALALIPRECMKRTKIDGYDISPKTKALVNVWAIGRDPSVWNEPEKFFPERFVDSSIDFRGNNFELLPFGSGKRICPGMTLGLATVELFLSYLLYYFDWKLVGGVPLDMTEAFAASLKRKIDLVLIPISVGPSPTTD